MKHTRLTFVTRVVILTAIYFVGGLLGQESAFRDVALVWPPAGIALAAIILFGYRFWPGVAMGAIMFSIMQGTPSVYFTSGTALGNTIGAVVCVFLLERFIRAKISLSRVRDTVGFIVFACLIGTTVNAAFNAVGQLYAKDIMWDDLFRKMMVWWVSNAMAGLVVTPFIITWGEATTLRWDFRSLIEALVCLTCLTLGTSLSLNSYYFSGIYPLAYLPYPFLIWGALRFGQRGATTGTLIVAALAIYGLQHNNGPFVLSGDVEKSLFLVGSYIGILAISNMLLAAAATERKLAEEAVADSEKRYRAVVEDQTELISRFKPDGTLTFVNATFCRFHGLSNKELLGQKSPLLTSENHDIHDQHIARLTMDKPVISYDYQLHRPDNHIVWHTCTLRQLYDQWGQPLEIQTVEQDITQRKQVEEALRKSEEMYELITKNVDDLIAVTDADGKRLYNNPSYEKIFGDPEKLVGTDSFEQIHPDDREKVRRVFRETIESGKGQRMEYRFKLKDESIRYIESVGTYVPGDHGQSGKVVSVSRDITARKQIEEDLAKARDAAVVTARHKAEFLANMSHEIRTPLNGVIGLTNLLLHTPLNKQQHEYAGSIRTCSDSLLSIINDILDFSKIEAGKLSLEILDFSLSEAVESSMDLLAERAQAKNVELVGFVKPGVPTLLRGDQGRLRQILVNLLSNAVKFTHVGEVVLTVSLSSETETHAVLLFEVRDTGIGISKDAQGSLFQSFSQADGSTTRKYGGTGLGLAISRQLVTLMNGQIGVNSAPGQGATFWFSIPFERQTVLAERPANLAKTRVLVVDDNATHRQLLEQQFQAWHMNADSTHIGHEALGLLYQAADKGQAYQVGLIDMNMPEMDGISLARAIKSDPKIANIRLILLTSLMHPPEADTLKAAGINATLPKPVKQSKLFDCLVNLTSEAPEQIIRPARVVIPSALATQESQNVRILIAEDNSINQMVALGQLKELGYSADTVANGLEVLQVVERIPYDIIFMDCQMPEMDGYEATRQLRQREQQRGATDAIKSHITIIAMTAHAMQGDREKCLEAGMDDYLVKPIEEEALKTALERWVPIAMKQSTMKTPIPAATAPAVTTNNKSEVVNPTPSPPPSADQPPPVDLKRLSRITGGDGAKLRMLTKLYLEQSQELMTGLENAVRDRSAKDVEFLAHKCCGASANCGANTIVAPLRELEKMGREGQLDNAEKFLYQAKQQLTAIQTYLDNYLKSI